MNQIQSSSFSVRRTLLSLEWFLLGAYIFICFSIGEMNFFYGFPNVAVIPFLIILWSLSFIFPQNQNTALRRAYIFLEIAIILIARTLGFDLGVLLYLVIVKSCFLLNRRDVIITVIVTGIFWHIIFAVSLTRVIDFFRSQVTNQSVINFIISDIVGYVIASIFVLLLSFVILAEQQSRKQAIALAQEVETLAATLERTRIAREIHDSLGHTLTTLDVQLELAQRLRQRDIEKTLQALDTAKMLASQCLQDVRMAVQTIRSSEFNLNEALRHLVDQVKYNQALTILLDINLPRLPLQTSHQIYCIVQEGLTNIQKHAYASHIILRGWSTPEGVNLELSDNGKGFNPEQPLSGFGLRGMQERVQMLGGKLKINSSPSQGTKLQVMIPLYNSDVRL